MSYIYDYDYLTAPEIFVFDDIIDLLSSISSLDDINESLSFFGDLASFDPYFCITDISSKTLIVGCISINLKPVKFLLIGIYLLLRLRILELKVSISAG